MSRSEIVTRPWLRLVAALALPAFSVLFVGLLMAQVAAREPVAARSGLSADDPSPPAEPVKLIFIHHSTGESWLLDDNGGLGQALMDNNYFVSDTNYGWGDDGIGDLTDIGHWWLWFRGSSSSTYMGALFSESGQSSWDYSRLASDPGGENEIVMFKSCFPNSNLMGNASDPPATGTNPLRGEDAYSEHHTVANAKGIYDDILEYFRTRRDKLFVVITAPPLSEPDHPANARAFNTWLVEDWLDSYPYQNVAVFDFYNVLTSNGGSAEVNDLGWATGNHHRWRAGAIEWVTDQGGDTAAYPSGPYDDHPSQAGNLKATGELVDLLNIFYHRWRAGATTPSPTPTPTPGVSRSPRQASGRVSPEESSTQPPTPTSTPTPTPTPTQPPGAALVSLTVTEADGIGRVSEPVTSGVPLPRSAGITDLASLRLQDGAGRTVPAQLVALARWGGAPDDMSKPVRWALLDFQADVTAAGSSTYRLVTGGGSPTYPALDVTEGASAVTVNTGAAVFSISTSDGSLTAPDLGSPIYGRAVDSTGEVYTTVGPATASVELAGPMRASIHVTGSYRSSAGAALLDYTSRYWFYAGTSTVRLFHTAENNTLCTIDPDDGQPQCYHIGSAGDVQVGDVSLVIPADVGGSLSYLAGGEGSAAGGSLSGDFVLYQDSSGTDSWDHFPSLTDWQGAPLDARPRMQACASFRGYRMTLGGATVDSGDQAQGWLTVSGSDGAWTVGVRDFWQSFPKALRAATDGTVEVGLFPDEYGPAGHAFSLRAGEHKTHEITLAVSSDAPATPLFARAPASWYVDSGAFGLTALPDHVDWPEHEDYVDHQLDTAPTYEEWMDWFPNLPTSIESLDFYGIFDYGDVPLDYEGYLVAPMNLKYNMDYGMWQQWARGGDPRWFTLAEAGGRHIADIDILHNLHSPRHWVDGNMFGHSYHDEDGLTNPHRNEGGNHPDTMSGVPGLLTTYYLTGYEKALEAALELADCIEYRAGNDANLCPYLTDCSGEGWALGYGMYDAGCRPAANALTILVAAYRATAESRFLTVADAVVQWAAAADQPYIDGPTGEDIAMRPWMLNMYLSALASYLEMRDELSLSDTVDGEVSYLAYADWLHTWPWLDLSAIATGARAAYPYEWWFNESEWNEDPSINNWLLLGADAMAYAHRLSGDSSYLERGASLFRAGTRDPWWEDDANTYSATKETANSVAYGHLFLHEWAASRGSKDREQQGE